MSVCSFGKITLRGLFEPRPPYSDNPDGAFGTELYGRLLYIGSRDAECLICAFDLLGTFPVEARRFCALVSAKTGIPESGVWYHELQIHAAPDGTTMRGEVIDALAERVSAEALRMKNEAKPFRCDCVCASVGNDFSFCREQYVKGLGGVTVWSGMSFDEKGRPYTQNPDIMLLRGYRPKLPVFDEKIYFDNPNDPLACLFVFRGENGSVLGTLSRFAAHPDAAVLFELRGISDQYRYNFDWPGYLSEYLESVFSAPSLYLNGPCADLSMKKGFDGMDTYEICAQEAKRLGVSLGKRLVSSFESSAESLGDKDYLSVSRLDIELPMRENFPESIASLAKCGENTAKAEEALQNAISRNAPAYLVKQLIDDRWRAGNERAIVEDICGFSDETLASRRVKVSLCAISLGSFLFLGVPGESLVETTRYLRSVSRGRHTVTVDEVNGYFDYMATPASLTHGGYTYWSSWVGRDAVPKLLSCAEKIMHNA